uniref:Ovule protein n=1 Tax=Heterorhabditis bacteriophora TaxID=37862 RepID=A0A1I7WIA5_HETBA
MIFLRGRFPVSKFKIKRPLLKLSNYKSCMIYGKNANKMTIIRVVISLNGKIEYFQVCVNIIKYYNGQPPPSRSAHSRPTFDKLERSKSRSSMIEKLDRSTQLTNFAIVVLLNEFHKCSSASYIGIIIE